MTWPVFLFVVTLVHGITSGLRLPAGCCEDELVAPYLCGKHVPVLNPVGGMFGWGLPVVSLGNFTMFMTAAMYWFFRPLRSGEKQALSRMFEPRRGYILN